MKSVIKFISNDIHAENGNRYGTKIQLYKWKVISYEVWDKSYEGLTNAVYNRTINIDHIISGIK